MVLEPCLHASKPELFQLRQFARKNGRIAEALFKYRCVCLAPQSETTTERGSYLTQCAGSKPAVTTPCHWHTSNWYFVFRNTCYPLLIQDLPHLLRQGPRGEWFLEERRLLLQYAVANHSVIGVA